MNKVFVSLAAATLLTISAPQASHAVEFDVCNALPDTNTATAVTVETVNGLVREYTGTNAVDVVIIDLNSVLLNEVVKVKVNTLMGNDAVCFIGDSNTTVETVEAFLGNGFDYFSGSGFTSYFVHGGLGNDTILGGSGNDLLMGHNGNDKVWGNDGDDEISGGIGNDVLYGGKGYDILSGLAGYDVLYGGPDFDTFSGGLGNNMFNIEDGEPISDLKNKRTNNTVKIKGEVVAQYIKGKM
jgi:Ca2+-binding RTX toxin-like protein